MAQEKITPALQALHTHVEHLGAPVLVIPAGFPGADAIRQNVAEFLKKGATRVAHLIMLIHDEEKKVE